MRGGGNVEFKFYPEYAEDLKYANQSNVQIPLIPGMYGQGVVLDVIVVPNADSNLHNVTVILDLPYRDWLTLQDEQAWKAVYQFALERHNKYKQEHPHMQTHEEEILQMKREQFLEAQQRESFHKRLLNFFRRRKHNRR